MENKKLITKYGETIDLKNPLQEYPRMQLQRESFLNLNGNWEYQITKRKDTFQDDAWKPIYVPFALGSRLSGTEGVELGIDEVLWCRKQFAYKPNAMHTRMNFEAVDQECTVFLNGIEVGTHRGGYTPFSFDVSEMIKYQNALLMRIVDFSEQGLYAYGKQKSEHGGMWYTPTAGVWGTVWLEDVPDHAVEDLKITPDYDNGKVYLDMEGGFKQAMVSLVEDGKVIHQGLTNDKHLEIPMENFHAWSPEDPFLYDLFIKTEDDLVRSYFGMRSFRANYDSDGIMRFCLNNKPLFLTGLLDQGYTTDGHMTYPSDQSIMDEIENIKALGFNMLRKHAKIESRRWYYHCDRMGMLVMQDMPNGGNYDYTRMTVLPTIGFTHKTDTKLGLKYGRTTEDSCKAYYEELDAMLDDLYNCTCIYAWCPFNEGWGQFNSKEVTEHIQNYDSTRLIDSASGWFDQGAGDFDSRHNYFHPFWIFHRDKKRILFLSEFGGYSYMEQGHSEADKLYGYKKFTDKIALNDAIEKLYKRDIFNKIKDGLSGCVYTQVSDIEDECNGLFTADRKVCKVDARRMKKMNDRLKRKVK